MEFSYVGKKKQIPNDSRVQKNKIMGLESSPARKKKKKGSSDYSGSEEEEEEEEEDDDEEDEDEEEEEENEEEENDEDVDLRDTDESDVHFSGTDDDEEDIITEDKEEMNDVESDTDSVTDKNGIKRELKRLAQALKVKTKKPKKTKKLPKESKKKKKSKCTFAKLLSKARRTTENHRNDVAFALASRASVEKENKEILIDDQLALIASKEQKEQKELKRKRMNKEKTQTSKGYNAFPSIVRGYNPSIIEVFTEREKQYASTRDQRTLIEIVKELDVKKTRFVPFTSNHNDSDFYCKPCSFCCLWCTEPFEWIPLPLPRRMSATRSGPDNFHVTGHYCTPSCVLAAAEEVCVVNHQRSLRPLVLHMLNSVYGYKSSIHLVSAPDRRMLMKFGGVMSIDIFRATGALGVKTVPIEMPLFPFCAGIEEIEKVKISVRETIAPDSVIEHVIRVVHGIGAQQMTMSNATYNQNNNNNFTKLKRPRQDTEISTARTPLQRFTAIPTITEQLAISERMMVLEKETIGEDTTRVKRKTLKDFMKLESKPRK